MCRFPLGSLVSAILQNAQHCSDRVWNLILQLEEVSHVLLDHFDHKVSRIFCRLFLRFAFGAAYGKQFVDVDGMAHASGAAFDA